MKKQHKCKPCNYIWKEEKVLIYQSRGNVMKYQYVTDNDRMYIKIKGQFLQIESMYEDEFGEWVFKIMDKQDDPIPHDVIDVTNAVL